MSDISFKIRAEALGKSLKNLSAEIEEEVNDAVKNLAHAAYTGITAKLQQMNISQGSRKDYMSALKFSELGNNSYLIYLDSDRAEKLENGQGAYSLRELMLKSTKIVQVGSRSGQPWVQRAKDGHKYAHVPMEHKPQANPKSDLATHIKSLNALGTNGKVQSLDKIFKGLDGKPLNGKVATVHKSDAPTPNLAGLVKYQHVAKSGKVSSIYMTYRTVSETGKDWMHPGSKGYKLFKEAEEYVEKEMDNIINTLLK